MIDDYEGNLMFRGLSLERISKIPKWLLDNVERNKPELNDQIYKAVMEVIGEDEPLEAAWDGKNIEIGDRNKLRAEQRQKVNKLFSKGENN